MVYRMKVAGLWRELPICKVTDTLYIAGFVAVGHDDAADETGGNTSCGTSS